MSSLIVPMTNITLSIEDSVYKKMRLHSEIKWSEYVRKIIHREIEKLEKLNKHPHQESIVTMQVSEAVLNEDWDNEADERWNDV